MVVVDAYYDYRSPFAYFAAHRIRTGKFSTPVSIEWRWLPVSIDALLNMQVSRPTWAPYTDPLAAPKRKNFLTDVVRSAEYYSVPIRPPNPPRSNSLPALCASLKLTRDGVAHDEFRTAVFEALWQKQLDIGDKSVLFDCAQKSGVARDVIEAAFAPEAKDELARATQETYELGVFGVPSFVSGGELFFGNDRLDVLAWRLKRDRL
jgi:2-hydroxychromene-2-carboxylate isomerase